MNFLDWIGIRKERRCLVIGSPAPDVPTRDENGKEVRLSELYGPRYTLIYFYPKADTSGCTIQACSLRDTFTELKSRGLRVVGVSADPPAAQLLFKEKHRLPYTLVADTDFAVAKAFGVRLMFGMPLRQSFIIKDGVVVWRDLHASTRAHTQDVLDALEALG